MLSLLVGCSRPVELTYAPRDEVAKLPAKHQEQIRQFLTAYFGTPSDPRWARPTGEEDLKDSLDRLHLKRGREVYTQQCAGCHGTTGDGQGPAGKYLDPPPRDYRLGRFKFGSTPRGSKPRQEDLVRIVRRGAKGTSMPAFRFMPNEDLVAVIDYVKVLSNRGELELELARYVENDVEEEADLDAEEVAALATRIAKRWDDAAKQIVMPKTVEPPYSEDSIAIGAKAFGELNCYKCHGKDGRGERAFNVGKDDWGRVAYAADLSSGLLHGGRRSIDIYRRIHSGINGTPMPASENPDSRKNETVEQRSDVIWHLAHFIRSIAEGREIPLDLVEEGIKAGADLAAPKAEAPSDKPESN